MFMLITLASCLTLGQEPGQVQQNTGAKPAVENKSTQQTSSSTPAKKAAPEKTTVMKPAPKPANMATINLANGVRKQLNVKHWPSIGNPEAKYVFVEMFDYTCPHCKNTHKSVEGAFKKYGKDLAVIVLPVPLDNKCNGAVRAANPKHAESCEVSRMAISVWRCKPSSFHQFHDWMFAAPGARTAFEARQFGEQLVGAEKLRAEMAKPYASQYIQSHVSLYMKAGASQVPKLMFPRRTMSGEVPTQTLVNTIAQQFADKK